MTRAHAREQDEIWKTSLEYHHMTYIDKNKAN